MTFKPKENTSGLDYRPIVVQQAARLNSAAGTCRLHSLRTVTIYQDILNSRADLTEWLIHWTRADQGGATARATLTKIAQEGFLLPSFAVRDGRATIYGPVPAVCFTEQPLREFERYVRIRNLVTAVSGFAVAVNKRDVYADGGLPVITGLSGMEEAIIDDDDYNPERRNIRQSSGLLLHEQYRYITINMNRQVDGQDRPIDWTHEREWRWTYEPFNNAPLSYPGFPLAGSGSNTGRGTHQGRFAFIVPDEHSARELRTVLAGLQASDGDGNQHLRSYHARYVTAARAARIFSLDIVEQECRAGHMQYAKIETHPA
jgi:hypothetical protein